MAYNADKLKTAPTSWADFWDTKKFPGKRGLRKGAKYTLEFALMADGVAREDVYPLLETDEGVDRAFDKMDGIRSGLQLWSSGREPVRMLNSGDVAMSMIWATTGATAASSARRCKPSALNVFSAAARLSASHLRICDKRPSSSSVHTAQPCPDLAIRSRLRPAKWRVIVGFLRRLKICQADKFSGQRLITHTDCSISNLPLTARSRTRRTNRQIRRTFHMWPSS